MISANEIKNLADLSRIQLSAAESGKLEHDLGAILDYVSELKAVPKADVSALVASENFNKLRSDENPEPSGESLGFVRVKKII